MNENTKKRLKLILKLFSVIIVILSSIWWYTSASSNISIQTAEALKFENSGNYQEAINTYNDLLKNWPPLLFDYQYGMIQLNLSRNYDHLADFGTGQENYLELSRDSLKQALTVFSPTRYPDKYVAIEENLGIIYQKLSEHRNRQENVQNSLNSFNLAYNALYGKGDINDYATFYMNLGITYENRGFYENNESDIQKARECFQKGLKYINIDNNPELYAKIQTNYGQVAGSFDDSLYAYREALKVYNPEKYPFEYALLQQNLGASYLNDFIETGSKEYPPNTTSLDIALSHLKNTHDYFTFDKRPIDYAKIKKIEGLVYVNLGLSKDREKNFILAKNAYTESLKVRNPIDFPREYAMTNADVAFLYLYLGDVKNNSEDRAAADEAFNKALTGFSSDSPEYNQIQTHYQEFQRLINS